MNRELDKKLCEEHPHLFADRRAPMQVTCMCWGFECGDGWYNLLKEAADKLEPLCKAEYENAMAKEKPWYPSIREAMGRIARSRLRFLWTPLYKVVNTVTGVYDSPIAWYGGAPCRASQVKEKYGTLRFYMVASTEGMEDIITEATRKSAITCETCGKPGKLRGEYWLYTACKTHTKKEGRDA